MKKSFVSQHKKAAFHQLLTRKTISKRKLPMGNDKTMKYQKMTKLCHDFQKSTNIFFSRSSEETCFFFMKKAVFDHFKKLALKFWGVERY